MRTKDAPRALIDEEITRVLRALYQESEAETYIYIYFFFLLFYKCHALTLWEMAVFNPTISSNLLNFLLVTSTEWVFFIEYLTKCYNKSS